VVEMQDKTIVSIARISAGTAILIATMVTGVNGAYQTLAMLLLGLPIEGLVKQSET